MIERVHFHRFKQYRDVTFDLRPGGISLLAGGNNSGKSTLLHGLAIWEFCKTVMTMEKSPEVLLAGAKHQGVGLGDEEFSPISVPSLSHLWTNLQTQKDSTESDGYTLRIGIDWSDPDGASKGLTFGLSLANDRLFVKAVDSNLEVGDSIPQIAYLPPFAGIVDKEERVSPAIRRRRIGEGLAGGVLRNLLLEMHEANLSERAKLRGTRSKISDRDLRQLRFDDPWERLQHTLREVFSTELIVQPFRDEYHSFIRVQVVKGRTDRYRLKRHKGYRPRDIMVEGSGFLQWLSVCVLAFSPSVDTLLLDEPDAHLHPSLQSRLLEVLSTALRGKQTLLATHSVEMIRRAEASLILEVKGTHRNRYLDQDYQKVALLEGLGSDYAPHIDQAKLSGLILFVEGVSDESILDILAEKLGYETPHPWVVWQTSRGHSERKQLFLGLREEIPELEVISLRDRDDTNVAQVKHDLKDSSAPFTENFKPLTWKRRTIENYLIDPSAIAKASERDVAEVERILVEKFGLSIGDSFPSHNAPQAILNVNGKDILKEFGIHATKVATALSADRIPEDVVTFFEHLYSETA